ncbi:TPA: hypothetical protein R0445_004280 [Salmonella enterica subsp. enterica serovar Hvittingfoss]|nr:hypothetical protein [Salmonella enterica subsp. enterica serovar Hvittingfoss]
MNGQNIGLSGPALSFSDILRPFAEGNEGDIVKFTVLLAGKAAGAPCGDVMHFLVNGPSLF